jgi:VanZ family protein
MMGQAKIAVFAMYALLVAFASLSPGTGVSIESWDKLAHFLSYGLFAILGFGLAGSRRGYFFLCLGIVAFSGLMEVGQSFVPGRFMSAYDMLANVVGVLLGATLITNLPGLRNLD